MKQKFDRSINQLISRNQRLKYSIRQSLGSSPKLRHLTLHHQAKGSIRSMKQKFDRKNLSDHKVFDHHLTDQSISPSPSLEKFDKSSNHLIDQPETKDLSFSLASK
jgi:hypothetical protein